MSFDEDKKRKKEKPSYSSPDRLRQDKNDDREKAKAQSQTKESLARLERENLQAQIEAAKEESRPAKDEKKEVASAHERDEDAGDAAEKFQAREEERRAAIDSASPESESQSLG